jgi:hypothetical protein
MPALALLEDVWNDLPIEVQTAILDEHCHLRSEYDIKEGYTFEKVRMKMIGEYVAFGVYITKRNKTYMHHHVPIIEVEKLERIIEALGDD